MPLIATRGAASAQGFGEFAQSSVNYIEDVFSTWLYTGNGSTQTITNGIDLSGKGGLVWVKSRSNAYDHALYDTARGINKELYSNTTAAQYTGAGTLTAFNSNGFTLGASSTGNFSGNTDVSWTFRKQAKFFDVVTYTGDGTSVRSIPHNLGSTPGFIIIKATSTTGDWSCYHRSLGVAGGYIRLNNTASAGGTAFATPINSTVFSIESGAPASMNTNGVSYVAYLFAHDAGGFGLTGTDNVISCGSYVGNGSTTGPTITLGYEPQWIMVKSSSAASNWIMLDNMRGVPTGGFDSDLYANSTYVGSPTVDFLDFTATGFIAKSNNSETNASGATYIYIAIRRGPMRTPTSGTSVFAVNTATSYAANQLIPTSFPPDADFNKARSTVLTGYSSSRLTGGYLQPTSTAAEVSGTWFYNGVGGQEYTNSIYTADPVYWQFRRAPGFFDVVCYTGVGASATLNHNLGVAPEMVIIKGRSVISNWETYLSVLGGTAGNALAVNSTAAKSGTPPVSSATTTTFTLNNGVSTSNGQTYVAYLFATLAGVSKVGSYAGSGILQTIPCGFTSGARFVLIKRTDIAGDWWVYDSARGITSGNDPYLFLNSTAAEVTGTNYVDTDSTGFKVTAAAPAGLNAVGGNYIFLAIA